MSLNSKILKEFEQSPILRAMSLATPEYVLIFDSKGKVQATNSRLDEFIKRTPKISFSSVDEKENYCETICNHDPSDDPSDSNPVNSSETTSDSEWCDHSRSMVPDMLGYCYSPEKGPRCCVGLLIMGHSRTAKRDGVEHAGDSTSKHDTGPAE